MPQEKINFEPEEKINFELETKLEKKSEGLLDRVGRFLESIPMRSARPAEGIGQGLASDESGNIAFDESNLRKELPTIGQTLGGIGAGIATGGASLPISVASGFGGQLAGGIIGRELARATGETELPSTGDMATNAALGEALGLGFRGAGKVASELDEIIPYLRGKKNLTDTKSSLIKTLNKWFTPEVEENFIPAIESAPGEIIPSELVLNELKKRNYPLTTSQVTGGSHAARIESTNPNIPNINIAQDVAMRDYAEDLLGRSIRGRGALGEATEKLTTENIKARATELGKERTSILSNLKSGPKKYYKLVYEDQPTGVLGTEGEVLTKKVAKPRAKIVDDPIDLQKSFAEARKLSRQFGKLANSNISNPSLKETYNEASDRIRGFLEEPLFDIKPSGKVPISDASVGSLDAADKTRTQLGRVISRLTKADPTNPNIPKLIRFREALNSDIEFALSGKDPALLQRWHQVNSNYEELSQIRQSSVGKKLGRESGAGFDPTQRIKSPEQGLEAPLASEANWNKFVKINGKEEGSNFLRENLITDAFDSTTGKFDASKARKFVKANQDKFTKTLTSEQKHSMNVFISALELQEKRKLSQGLIPAAQLNTERQMAYAIPSGASAVLSNNLNSPTAFRALTSAGYLLLEKGGLGKLLADPKFAYANAKLLELPEGSTAVMPQLRTILSIAGRLGVQGAVRYQDGTEDPVRFDTNGNFIFPDEKK